ncbi:hypothetical protein FHR75_002136 [Kineococcus radiotolerans]|uniref:DUF4190 domain-containing protein n=1 Tax=Kineococcus radiotolerans TaxID=131568 RepID=A0A7W4TMN0_KINRA|nr:DUF4190 domain-containing protein [Kineococcus radiotolerans]MBB2901348.1 hypothetical protein [Kineococcus radiotolerans]
MSSEYAPAGAHGYGDPVPTPRNGAAVAGLVLGIVALLLCLTVLGAVLSVLLAVVGLVLSIVGLRRVGRRRATNKGVAVTGLVVNAVALLIAAVITAFLAVGLAYALDNGGSDAWSCLVDAGGDQAAVQRCVDDLDAGTAGR